MIYVTMIWNVYKCSQILSVSRVSTEFKSKLWTEIFTVFKDKIYDPIHWSINYGRKTTIKSSTITWKSSTELDNVGGCVSFCYLPAAIAAIVIASQYDKETSPCNDGNPKYLVDLVTFLYVAGGIQCGFSALYFLGLCSQKESCMKSLNQIYSCLGLFFFAWSVVGLIIYDQQMSKQCQNEPIGIMILSWCVIQLALGVAICCCIFVTICCGAAVFGMFSLTQSNNDREIISDHDVDIETTGDEDAALKQIKNVIVTICTLFIIISQFINKHTLRVLLQTNFWMCIDCICNILVLNIKNRY